MKSLLKCREFNYFAEREDHDFLFLLVHRLVVGKLTLFKGNYWFYHPAAHFKATSMQVVSLRDLEQTKVWYKDNPEVRGRIKGWGIKDTPFIHVYWDHTPMKANTYNFATTIPNSGRIIGFPCALPDNNFLELA